MQEPQAVQEPPLEDTAMTVASPKDREGPASGAGKGCTAPRSGGRQTGWAALPRGAVPTGIWQSTISRDHASCGTWNSLGLS